jgi:hydroxymethylglutaryl-CoA reductase
MTDAYTAASAASTALGARAPRRALARTWAALSTGDAARAASSRPAAASTWAPPTDERERHRRARAAPRRGAQLPGQRPRRVVPMAVEEPSVVAAASNAARMVRAVRGLPRRGDPAVMTAQVQFDDVPDPDGAAARRAGGRGSALLRWATRRSRAWSSGAAAAATSTCGCSTRRRAWWWCTSTSTWATRWAPTPSTPWPRPSPRPLHELVGGTVGLRILSNLPRGAGCAASRCEVTDEALGGADVADGIARASRFAELDPLPRGHPQQGLHERPRRRRGGPRAGLALLEAGAHAWARAAAGTAR